MTSVSLSIGNVHFSIGHAKLADGSSGWKATAKDMVEDKLVHLDVRDADMQDFIRALNALNGGANG